MKNQMHNLERGPNVFMLVISVIFIAHSALQHAVAADTARILQPDSELSLGGSALITGHLTERDLFVNDVIDIDISISIPKSNSEGRFSKRFKRVPILTDLELLPCRATLWYSIIPTPTDYTLSLEEFVVEQNCEGLLSDGLLPGEFFWELNVNGKVVSRRSEANPLREVSDGNQIPINVETTHKQRKYDYRFLPDNKLEVKAHFRNVTENTNFVTPFSFTLNSLSHDFEESNLPIQLSDKELGGDGVLRPGEATSVVTFEVIHQNKPFAFFVDANAVVKELRTMEVGKVGLGTVISEPPGIDCGADCNESYREGTSVVLRAMPEETSTFDRWEECTSISNTTDCVVEITDDITVTAHFIIPPQSLKVTADGSGTGTVISEPPGIDCDPTCEKGYAINTNVTLTAQPDENSFFEGWTGCDNVLNDVCAVHMANDKAITARFRSCEVGPNDNVTIKKQEDVNRVYGCRSIGILIITEFQDPLTVSFDALRFLDHIEDLRIINNSSIQLFPFETFANLFTVGNLRIDANKNLGNILSWFPMLVNISGDFVIANNGAFTIIDDFQSLSEVGGTFRIEKNSDLTQILGFDPFVNGAFFHPNIIVSDNPKFDCSISAFKSNTLIGTPIVNVSEGNNVNCKTE